MAHIDLTKPNSSATLNFIKKNLVLEDELATRTWKFPFKIIWYYSSNFKTLPRRNSNLSQIDNSYPAYEFLVLYKFYSLISFDFYFCQAVQLHGLSQGLNPEPHQWQYQVLTTGPPGNSQFALKKKKIWPCCMACGILVPWLTLLAWNLNHDHRKFPVISFEARKDLTGHLLWHSCYQ